VNQRSGGNFLCGGNFKQGVMTITTFKMYGGLLDLRNTFGNVVVTNLHNENDANVIRIPAGKVVTIT
jgi:hypothetical protein